MNPVPPERHLLRAKDLADGRYHERIGVDDMAAAAGLSRAHFSREFRRTFAEPPRRYLLKRRLERAASLLRYTDYPVSDICLAVGLLSIGSFTSSFKAEYGLTPTAYREKYPPASAYVGLPGCVVRLNGRLGSSTNGEVPPDPRP